MLLIAFLKQMKQFSLWEEEEEEDREKYWRKCERSLERRETAGSD
jgi:hypothetical protein